MGRCWEALALIGLTGCGGLYSSPQVSSGTASVGDREGRLFMKKRHSTAEREQ